MRNTKNAFTLVELIVVITILAVLGTIAFVSLQGYSRDAKNSKVTADIRTVVSGVETALTDGTTNMKNVVTQSATIITKKGTANVGSTNTNLLKLTTGTAGSGAFDIANASTGEYNVGTINFAAIKQNGDDFLDSAKNEYPAAAVASGSVAFYQIGWVTEDASGGNTIILKGNYVKQGAATDTTALLSDSSGSSPKVVADAISNGATGTFY